MNADKSDQPEVPGGRRGGMMVSKMIIEQRDNQLVVEIFRKNRDGEDVSSKATYALDGKKCKNDSNWETRESIDNWSKDGKMLAIESTMTMSRCDRSSRWNPLKNGNWIRMS
ncbi:hypothetical protein L0Z72_09355 [candidate division KSB1 bacterium]|nr:hypothetical protein [candidate division KSB1 bacterium]